MRSLLVILLALSMAGCYHARIETGLTPSARVINQPFASGWIYGLVPPSTVEAAEQCPNGVAIVETQLSFVNQLVNALTLGIYTPMHIKVTCAAGETSALPAPSEAVAVAPNADRAAVTEAFQHAADQAVASEQPVLVRFE